MNRNSNKARSFQKLSLVAGLLAIALAGCTTLTPEQQRAEDEKTCLSYGFKPKSEAMANCLLQIHLDRRADIRAWQNERPQFSTPMVIYQPVVVPR
ncbi:hypothetical protein K1X45_10500 [Pseudochrobactrum sp. Wa41.01b-1]|uniref:hypothetical protein n=1 Tax=Pseudochrobactrum sp. Wa41.01b-1 TaxID=2864102 RepID=UPI001C68E974|nr:hypothetical protein [Pseudochrobactrum sp. Wa41.01b-1]QYM71944.1 hypothetical protein K1X45_10500 [Pseudochrobactrum sp. Wa41.01b-1]